MGIFNIYVCHDSAHAQDNTAHAEVLVRAMGRHGFPGIFPAMVWHAAAFSCNGSARGICADAYNYLVLVNATALGSLIRPRAITRCNLAVSDMYMRVFVKTHQIAYTYCSVGISDLKPLTGTSADQLPHRKNRPLATA